MATGAMLVIGGGAQAQIVDWNGAVDSEFGTDGNWDTGVAPGSADQVTITDSTANPTVVSDARDVDTTEISGSGDLTINDGASLDSVTSVLTGGRLTVEGLHSGAVTSGTDGTVIVNATGVVAGASILDDGLIEVNGGQLSVTETVTINADGVLDVNSGAIGAVTLNAGGAANLGGGTLQSFTQDAGFAGQTFLNGSTITGTTDINGGTFTFIAGMLGDIENAASFTADGDVLVGGNFLGETGGTLSFNGGGAVSNTLTVNGLDGFTLAGELTAAQLGTTITAGTITLNTGAQFNGVAALGSTGPDEVTLDGNVVNNTVLTTVADVTLLGSFANNNALTVTNAITSGGNLLTSTGTLNIDTGGAVSGDVTASDGLVTVNADPAGAAEIGGTLTLTSDIGSGNTGALLLTDGNLGAVVNAGLTDTTGANGTVDDLDAGNDGVEITVDAGILGSLTNTSGETVLNGGEVTTTTTVAGGTVTNNGATLTGEVLTSGTGTFTQTAGSVGTRIENGGGAVNLLGGTAAGLLNSGLAGVSTVTDGTFSGGVTILGGSLVVSEATPDAGREVGGTIRLGPNGSLRVTAGQVASVINNGGLVNFTGGSLVSLENSEMGTVDLEGTVAVGDSVTNESALNIKSGTTTVEGGTGVTQNESGGTLTIETMAELESNVINDAGATLTINAGTLRGDLTNNGAANLNGIVTVTGDYTQIADSGAVTTVDGTATVGGVLNLTAGALSVTEGSQLSATGGATTSGGLIEGQVAGDLTATGDVDVLGTGSVTGTLINTGLGSSNAGSLGALTNNAGSFDNSGSISGLADINLGDFTFSGGSIGSVENAVANFNVTGTASVTGALTNTGTVTIAANQRLSVGTLANTGGTVNVGTDAFLLGTGNTTNNSGLLEVADGGTVTDTGAINNLAGGTITFLGGGTLTADDDALGDEGITNAAAINFNGGTGTTVSVSTGGVGTFVNGTGTVTVAAGSTVDLRGVGAVGLENRSTLTVNSGASLIGGIQNFGITTADGTITGAFGNRIGGTLNLNGALNGALSNFAAVTTAPAARFGTTVTNTGTGVITGNVNFSTAAALSNSGTITQNVINAATLQNTASGILGGSAANAHSATGIVTNAGLINGDLAITGATATLTNTGEITGGVTTQAGVNNDGGQIRQDLTSTSGNVTNTLGTIDGAVSLAGALVNTNGIIGGIVTSTFGTVNNNGGQINADGVVTDTTTAAGNLGNNNGSVIGNVILSAGGLVSNTSGSITGDVTVAGTSNNTGGAIGGALVQNGGVFTNGTGTIGGAVTINDGTLVLTGVTELNDTVTVNSGAAAALQLNGGTTTITGDLTNRGSITATASSASVINVDGTASNGVLINDGLLTTIGTATLTINVDTAIFDSNSEVLGNVTVNARVVTNAGSFSISGPQTASIANTGTIRVVGPTTMQGNDILNDDTFIVTSGNALTQVRAFDNNSTLNLEASASVVVDGANPPTALTGLLDGEFRNDGATTLANGASLTAAFITNGADGIDLGTDARLTASLGRILNNATLDVADGAVVTALGGIGNTGRIAFAADGTLNADSDDSGQAVNNTGQIVTAGTGGTVTVGNGVLDVINNTAGGQITIGAGDTFGGAALSIANSGTTSRIDIGEGATLQVQTLSNSAGARIVNAGAISPLATVTNGVDGVLINAATGTTGDLINDGTVTNAGRIGDIATGPTGSLRATDGSRQEAVVNTGTTSLLGGSALRVTQDTGASGDLSIGTSGTTFTIDQVLTANDGTTRIGADGIIEGRVTAGDGIGAARSALVVSLGALNDGVTVNSDGLLRLNGGTAAGIELDGGEATIGAQGVAAQVAGVLQLRDGTATVGDDGTVTGLTTVGDTLGDAGSARVISTGTLADATVNSDGLLDIDGGSTGALTVIGGVLRNAGTAQSVLALSGGQVTIETGGTVTDPLTNQGGTVTVAGGDVPMLSNLTGTVDITSGTVSVLENAGTVTNAGLVAGLTQSAGSFTNTGTVTTATIGDIAAPPSASGGSFTTSGTVGLIDLFGGTATVTGGTVTTANNAGGSLGITAGTVQNLTSAATTTNSGTILTATISGGSLANTGRVTGDIAISGGDVTSTNQVANVSLTGGTFTNLRGTAGTITNQGGTVTVNDGTTGAITNNSGVLTVAAAGQTGAVTNASTVDNAGTVQSLSNLAGRFDNTGTLSGLASLDAGIVTNTGRIGAVSATGGTLTSSAGSVGTVTNAGGGLSFTGGTVGVITNTSGSVTLSTTAAEITNAGVLAVTAAGNVTGDVATQAGSTNNIDGAIGGTLTNAATLTTLAGAVTGRIINESAASLTVDGDSSASSVVQSGTLTVAAGATLTADVQTQAGSLTTVSGTVAGEVTNAGTFTGTGRTTGLLRNDGGTLTFDGIFAAQGGIRNAGTLTQGAASVLTGRVTNIQGGVADLDGRIVGALINQGELTLSGEVTGDLSNAGDGLLTIDGDVAVGGTVNNAASFTIASGSLGASGAGPLMLTQTGSFTLADGTSIDLNGGLFVNNGTLTSGAIIIGDLTQNAFASLEGIVQGDVITSGASETTITGDLSFGALDNFGTINLTDGTTTATAALNRGALTIAQGATLTGPATLQNGFDSQLTIAGTADSNVVARNVFAQTGRVTGDLELFGTADLAGTIDGTLMNNGAAELTADLAVGGEAANSGELTIATGTVLTTPETTNIGMLNVDGTLFGDLDNFGFATITGTVDGAVISTNDVTLEGLLTGDLLNTANATVSGSVNGSVQNDGVLILSGDIGGTLNSAVGAITLVEGAAQVAGAVTDAGTFDVASGGALRATSGVTIAGMSTVSGTVTGDVVVTEQGNLNVASGGTVAGNLANTGFSEVAGTVTGTVDTIGTFGLAATGRLADALNNDGMADIAGAVEGAVRNTSSLTVASTGTLLQTLDNSAMASIAGRVTGAVANEADLTVEQSGTIVARVANAAGASTRIAGSIGGLDAVGGRITLEQSGIIAGTTQIGAALVTAQGGTFGASVVNAGTLEIRGDSQIAGDLTNTGLLDGTTTSDDLTLTISGAFINESRISNAGAAGDFNIAAGSIVLGSLSDVQGAVTLIGETENNGSIRFDRNSTQNGTLRNATGGVIAASADVDFQGHILDNDGTVTVTDAGALTDVGPVANSGTFTIAEGGQVTAELTTNTAGGILTNSGTLTTNLVNDASGSVTSTGVLAGNVTNAQGGVMVLDGTVGGNVVNSGELTGAGQIAGILQTQQTGTTQIDGTLSAMQSQITGGRLGVGQTGTLATVDGVTVTAAGVLESQGLIDSDVTVSADSQILSSGQISGRLTNNGQAELSGILDDTLANTASGTVQVMGDLVAQAVENAGTTVIETTGTLSAIDGVTSDGVLTVAGQLIGDVASTEGGSLEITGQVTGDVAAQGAVALAGTLDGALTATGAQVTAGAALSTITGAADLVDSDVTVATGGLLAFDGGASLDAASTLAAQGAVSGDITSLGAVTLAQGLDGSLTSGGAAIVAGAVAGDLNVTGGTLELQGDVSIGERFSTVLDLDVAEGQTLSAGQFAFEGQTLNVNGNLDAFTTLGTADRDLAATVLNLSPGARIAGLRSFGTLRSTGASQIDGDFDNNGVIDLTGNDTPGDSLTINGDIGGNTTLFVDVDLGTSTGSSASQGDTLVVNGFANGNFDVRLNVVSLAIGEQENDIVILDLDPANALDSEYTFVLGNAAEIPTSERIVFSLARNDDAGSLNFGDLVLVDQVNPAIGALAGNVSLSQSLIGSVVNRPTSPFVVPAATGDACGAGAWSRATGGQATASGNTSGTLSELRSEIEATYQGLQVGGDFGCYQGAFNGWDLTFGGLGGYNTGSGTQPVFAIDPTDPTRLTGFQTSVTESDFDQIYGGLYAIAARDRLAFDLQVNVGKTDFVLNNRSIGGAAIGLGLTDTEFDITTTTISGALSYGFDLPAEGFSITPTAGFALSRSQTSTIQFDDGATLEVDDSDTQVAFVGATLSRVRIAETGDSALAFFGTATAYNDFSDGLESTFTLPGLDGGADLIENLTSENLGFYGEVSVGMNYTRIMQANENGLPLRQLSASARADFRLSDNLDSAALTAQIRFQF